MFVLFFIYFENKINELGLSKVHKNKEKRVRMLTMFNYNQALPNKRALEEDCMTDRLEARK